MQNERIPMLSRRGFLVGSAAIGLTALVGGRLARKMLRTEGTYRDIAGAGPSPVIFDWRELAVMTLVVDRIVMPTEAMPSVFETMTARRVDRELSYGSPKLREDMKASLGYLEIMPSLSGDLRPFSSLSFPEQTEVIRGLRDSSTTDRSIYMALKFFAGFFYYTDDRSWKSVGYAGPMMPEKPFEAGTRISNLSVSGPGQAS